MKANQRCAGNTGSWKDNMRVPIRICGKLCFVPLKNLALPCVHKVPWQQVRFYDLIFGFSN